MDSLDTNLLRDDMEQVRMIQGRKKGYADRRVRPLEFIESDHIFLRMSTIKSMIQFGKKSKFSPRFIGLFKILRRVGEVAYRFVFPPSLPTVHPVFHVFMLRKYVSDESHVLSLGTEELGLNLTFENKPKAILNR
ncbi:uncharacterized protein LOC129894198 [Solanum dulcamara]|uniref:uncharacterized protein LOC129894198 n=1 Tax=Solanum dulcamara TaxID=45834 RepID=UPI00248530E0|nr:uncharacterized protein LOC129894198 [Solanum dulcamara]